MNTKDKWEPLIRMAGWVTLAYLIYKLPTRIPPPIPEKDAIGINTIVIKKKGYLKDLRCRLFHGKHTSTDFGFLDLVDGKMVFRYKCKKCKTEFLANSRLNKFRVYEKI